MSTIHYQEQKSYVDCPVLSEIVKTTNDNLPELQILPVDVINGDEFAFYKRTKEIDTPIFVHPDSGVTTSSVKFAKQKRELRHIKRRMEVTKDARDANMQDGNNIDLWDETRMAEVENLNRKLVSGLYTKESDAAGNTLDDFVAYQVDALSKDINSFDDFASLDNATVLTDVYLCFVSTMGLHLKYGNGTTLNFEPERIYERRDDKKSAELGQEAYYEIYSQYVKGCYSPTAKTEFDVVKLVNVPVTRVADFYLDICVDTVLSFLYNEVNVFPNAVFADKRVISNMSQEYVKSGIKGGGITQNDLLTVHGDATGRNIPYFNRSNLAVVESTRIPTYTFADKKTGNKTRID